MSDETFDADWLSLREPVDHRSRARSLVTELRREGVRRGWSRLVDLATGTGSNLRYISARIPWAREWAVVDHDAELLRGVTAPSSAHTLRRVHGDLSSDGLEEIRCCHVVTASAFLDLVSEAWLLELLHRCVDAGAALYATLSYDGSVRWLGGAGASDPAGGSDVAVDGPGSVIHRTGSAVDGTDGLVLDAVNEHQRTDKGLLGPALGPEAAGAAEILFREVGWEVRMEPSPWILRGPADAPLLTRLVEGWAEAAVHTRPDHESRIRAWSKRRIRDVVTGAVTLRVGHLDLLAIPPARPSDPP